VFQSPRELEIHGEKKPDLFFWGKQSPLSREESLLGSLKASDGKKEEKE